MDLLERYTSPSSPLKRLGTVCDSAEILYLQDQVGTVYSSPEARSYVSQITAATRKHAALSLGASPRGAIDMLRDAQASALLNGRDYVLYSFRTALRPIAASKLEIKVSRKISRSMTMEATD